MLSNLCTKYLDKGHTVLTGFALHSGCPGWEYGAGVG